MFDNLADSVSQKICEFIAQGFYKILGFGVDVVSAGLLILLLLGLIRLIPKTEKEFRSPIMDKMSTYAIFLVFLRIFSPIVQSLVK
jgi:hypothetical protein